MEAQLHHTRRRNYDDPIQTAAVTEVHEEVGDSGKTKSTMKKKTETSKTTIKHGRGNNHGGEDHHDDAETVNDSPAVKSGLIEPTVMGKPVLAEDLHATHSDIVDPPVRSFGKWEKEVRQGAQPPFSTGYGGTHSTHQSKEAGHPVYGQQEVNKGQSRVNIGKSTGMKEEEDFSRAPPPPSTGVYVTHLADQSQVGPHFYGEKK